MAHRLKTDIRYNVTLAASLVPRSLSFYIPLLPPSVNHYVVHSGGKHIKAPETLLWQDTFALSAPKNMFVVGDRFSVTLSIILGKGDRGDVDNFPKSVLDSIATAGMLRNK